MLSLAFALCMCLHERERETLNEEQDDNGEERSMLVDIGAQNAALLHLHGSRTI